MTLREKQSIFIQNIARLITWAFENGYELTAGEFLRTPEQQQLYVNQGKSQTSNSRHLVRMAADLNLFINGEYKTDKESYRPLADYWTSLHPDNIAGYSFGWDANHFEMKP